jgi:hypothetical protein
METCQPALKSLFSQINKALLNGPAVTSLDIAFSSSKCLFSIFSVAKTSALATNDAVTHAAQPLLGNCIHAERTRAISRRIVIDRNEHKRREGLTALKCSE